MRLSLALVRTFAALLIAAAPRAAAAQTPAPPPTPIPPVKETVSVVATRIPEAPHDVPESIEVLTADDLRNLNATTLKDALSLAAGVAIAPGGDAGPAGSVPEFWGLREFDAFLLVVDGVPWGGAFNPALTSLSLRDVERVEILRGAAPVTYGATSFVGVIHVVHRPGTESANYASAALANHGTGGAAVDLALQPYAGWESRLSVDVDRQGFVDDRTSFARGHALFRTTKTDGDRRMWLLADLNLLRQDPSSPHPREGAALSTLVPRDANYNPDNAFLNENRFALTFGLERPLLEDATLSASASFAHTGTDAFRGFLTTIADAPDNATGLRQQIDQNDLYADAHLTWPERSHVRFVAGVDFLHGSGDSEGATFRYTVPLAGDIATAVTKPSTLDLGSEARRDFFGAYGLAEWRPRPDLTVAVGLRANITSEEREEGEETAPAPGENDGDTNFRFSGSVGAIYTAWSEGVNHLKVFGNYRNTFKPAAFDFGLGEDGAGEGGLLKPETARSFEGGVKARVLDGQADFEASVFRMDFSNLVTPTIVGGLPARVNAGETRFQGFEVASDYRWKYDVSARASYSFHDATFVDFVQDFDGTLTQLAGNRFEMSARHLFSLGAFVAPSFGPFGSFVVKYTGDRYLNKRNTALAGGFATVDLGVGYRYGQYELRLDARNIGDRRDPVAESELGDAQYYLMFPREVRVSLAVKF